MREKNWWKEHRAGIRNALIGAAVIGVAVGGWGTYTMYRNRRMTEMMIEARNQERVQQKAENQMPQNIDEIPIAPGQKEEQTADPRDLNLLPVLAENPVTYQGKPIAATSM